MGVLVGCTLHRNLLFHTTRTPRYVSCDCCTPVCGQFNSRAKSANHVFLASLCNIHNFILYCELVMSHRPHWSRSLITPCPKLELHDFGARAMWFECFIFVMHVYMDSFLFSFLHFQPQGRNVFTWFQWAVELPFSLFRWMTVPPCNHVSPLNHNHKNNLMMCFHGI